MGNEYLLDFLKITGWTAPTRLRDVNTKQNTSLLSPTGTLVRQADGHIVESLHLRSDTSCLNMKNDSHNNSGKKKERKWTGAGDEQHRAKCGVVGSWWDTAPVSMNTFLSDSGHGRLERNEELIKS